MLQPRAGKALQPPEAAAVKQFYTDIFQLKAGKRSTLLQGGSSGEKRYQSEVIGPPQRIEEHHSVIIKNVSKGLSKVLEL